MNRVYFNETPPATCDLCDPLEPFQGCFADIISGNAENNFCRIGTDRLIRKKRYQKQKNYQHEVNFGQFFHW
jgi:hypothetical protein